MAECLRCARCGGLEPLPKGHEGRLHLKQWGMLARGLVYCQLLGPSGYQRFRSVDSKDECKYFDPEPDTERIERRIKTVRILRAAFDKWRIDQQLKAKQAKDKK